MRFRLRLLNGDSRCRDLLRKGFENRLQRQGLLRDDHLRCVHGFFRKVECSNLELWVLADLSYHFLNGASQLIGGTLNVGNTDRIARVDGPLPWGGLRLCD